jgi:mycothiol synthase
VKAGLPFSHVNMWRDVRPEDRGELWRLDHAIKRVDGAESISDRAGEALSADHALCVCLPSGAIVGVGYVKSNTIGGGVRPECRRRGVGTRLLEWTLERAPPGIELTIRSEALTSDAHALYVRHGFTPRMTETRMVCTSSAELPDVQLPAGVQTVPWTSSTTRLFFAAYRASFADRPGFPDPPADEWIADHDGQAFQSDLSRVALLNDELLGFITVEVKANLGWIDQLGVAPEWRRRGLAGALLTGALRQLRAAHVAEVFLHVNANNPVGTKFFTRASFRPQLQRARYTRA